MKRIALDHPKLYDLAEALEELDVPASFSLPTATGVLERLWGFTAKHAPTGRIGRFTAQRIADALGWRRDPGALLAALVTTRWLERDAEQILVVGWSRHADKHVHWSLVRRHQCFHDGTPPNLKHAMKGEREAWAAEERRRMNAVGRGGATGGQAADVPDGEAGGEPGEPSGGVEPEPEPEREPERKSQARAKEPTVAATHPRQPRGARSRVGQDGKWLSIKDEDLESLRGLQRLHLHACALGLAEKTEAGEFAFVSLAMYAKRKAKTNTAGYLATLIRKPDWKRDISQKDEDEARRFRARARGRAVFGRQPRHDGDRAKSARPARASPGAHLESAGRRRYR